MLHDLFLQIPTWIRSSGENGTETDIIGTSTHPLRAWDYILEICQNRLKQRTPPAAATTTTAPSVATTLHPSVVPTYQERPILRA